MSAITDKIVIVRSIGGRSRLSRIVSHAMAGNKRQPAPFIGGITSTACNREIRIPVPWGHIAGKEWGRAGGHRILGLHGWQDNCGTFDQLAPLLPNNFHFVAIDLPGHGFSSHRPVGVNYDMISYVVDVHRVLQHLEWTGDSFSFLSHSMGSGISLVYAAAFPTHVKKLVSLDYIKFQKRETDFPTTVANCVEKLLQYEKLLQRANFELSMLDAVHLLVDAMGGWVTEESAKILLKRGSVPSGNGSRVMFTRDARLKVLVPASPDEDFVSIIQNLRQCEVLIIRANEGIVKPGTYEESEKLFRDNCKFFGLISVEGTHHVHLNDPERVAPHIIDFLNS